MSSPPHPSYPNLGPHTPKFLTTTSPAARSHFTTALLWTYAFNHEAAIAAFETANTLDPHCIMALWGLAFALGPNYNKPWSAFSPEEREVNLRRASVALVGAEAMMEFVDCTEVERALVRALRRRYPISEGEVEGDGEGYAAAMKGVYEEFGEGDVDVVALYVDSLMNLSPWGLWDLRTGEPAEGARTLEAKEILEKALATDHGKNHPGLLHLYIHLMEMSPSPSSALPIANRLRGLCPDAGHLEHMPSHLDVLCGDWESAITSNTAAIRADSKLPSPNQYPFYTLYKAHNLHFRIYAAMFAGRYSLALETADLIEEALPEELLRTENPPMADWLEAFIPLRTHILVRFGRWSDILSLPFPEDAELYCVTTSMLHYARGISFSFLGKLEEAKEEKEAFISCLSAVPESRTLFNNTARDILSIASSLLSGEISFRSADPASAFTHLRTAIEKSDNLPYDEPWGWMQPPRHAYGALLLEHASEASARIELGTVRQKELVEEAKEVYAADLGISEVLPRALRHPKNVWALHGYVECLRLLGEEIPKELLKQLEDLEKQADVKVRASCFCRREEEGTK